MPPALSLDYNGGVGFRFRMGEGAGKPNYILQTSRTLKWTNLPPDLLDLCNTDAVHVDTVRHFALGPDGKWYLEHVYDGKLICNHSTNYLDGVKIDWKNGPIYHIEYGAGKTVWGVQKKQTVSLNTVTFSAHLPSDFEEMLQVRLRDGVIKDYNTDFRYAANWQKRAVGVRHIASSGLEWESAS
ncbi:hypothetical protein MMC27_001610 [Xylographa pallens]|nr:hypothetical protein [Xylographa pallens]